MSFVKIRTNDTELVELSQLAINELRQKLLQSQASEARLRDLVKHLRPKFGDVGTRDIDVAKTQAMFDEAIASVNTAELEAYVESEIERRLGEPDIWLTEKEYNALKRAQKTERETVALYAKKG